MVSSSGSDMTTILLERYRVEATLGEGSFGTVVRGFDTRLKRTVAIKTLKRSLANTDVEQFRMLEERFAREAEAGSRMGIHPNLVTVHDLVIEPDHTQYLILEFVRGGTLADRLRHGALSLHEAMRITADVARGLQSAHDVGIVHRDVKPANIFVAGDGRAQLGDFGIAQIDDVSGRTHTAIHHPGTPLYMSPEQTNLTGYVRPASDQYSLGLVAFEMVTGQAYKRIGERAATALLEAQPTAVANLIDDMLATDPDDRHPSCDHVIRRIEMIFRQQGWTDTQLDVQQIVSEAGRPAFQPPGAGSGLPSASSGSIPTIATSGGANSQAADVTVPIASKSDSGEWANTPTISTASGSGAHFGAAPPTALSSQSGSSYAPVKRSRRGPFILGGAIALALLIVIAGAAALALRNGLLTPAVTATAQPPAATVAASAVVLASPTPQPTAVTPTVAPTVAPSPTAAIARATTAPSPAPAPASSIAIFSAGTTNQQLTTVNGDDVVTTFITGQEVFGFVNFGGALAGQDIVQVTLSTNGAPQQPQSFTLTKSDGFLVFSLGKLGVGDYQLIVSYNGKVAKTADFRVNQPPPTPRPPTAVPTRVTSTVTPTPNNQPTVTTVRPTVTPTKSIPPTQPAPTP